MNNYAYATVITKDFYLPFLIRQKQMMEILGCKYPFIVLVSDTVSKYVQIELEKYNILYKNIPTLKFNSPTENKRYEDTINKFQCFNLIEYEKIFFLDADIILCENLDYIFDTVTFEDENFLYLIKTVGEQTSLIQNFEEKNFFASCVIFLKPSYQTFQYIINLANQKKYYTDEEFIHENKIFYNCEHENFNAKIFNKHLHFSGFYKINQNNSNNVFSKIFDYKNFNDIDFYNFIKNNYYQLEEYLLKKTVFNDYFNLMYEQSERYDNCSNNYYIFSLKSKQEIPIAIRVYERLNYLNTKNNFLLLISNSLKNDIDIFDKFNIEYILVADEMNNVNYCNGINAEKIIYFEQFVFFKENLDFLFNEKLPYYNKKYFLYFFDFKNLNKSIENNNLLFVDKTCLDYYLSLNVVLIDSDIINFKDYKGIEGLFYSWSALKFNHILDQEWRRIKIGIDQFNKLNIIPKNLVFKNT